MLDDLRFGFRRVLRAPASSFTIITILAAGIGATGAMVSVLDALVYRPLNLPNPDALVSISARDARQLPRLMSLTTIDHLHASDLPVDGWCGQNRIIEPTVPGDGRAEGASSPQTASASLASRRSSAAASRRARRRSPVPADRSPSSVTASGSACSAGLLTCWAEHWTSTARR